MKHVKTINLIYYTKTQGRYYVNHKWVGNFYKDREGKLRDAQTKEVL